jgi:hypothetical protein
LGLAVYEGVDPERVEPHVPAIMAPSSCLRPLTADRVDVVLLFEEARFPDTPAGENPVAYVKLLSCAERPEGLAREAANEAPRVSLATWIDGDALAAFFDGLGFPQQPATVTFSSLPSGYAVTAGHEGSSLVEARFVTSGVRRPPIAPCEPSTRNGRSISAGSSGDLVALDWNKTEAICPAEAEVT